MRKLSVFLVLFATLGPIPAIEAQGIGGFIKKKVEEKTKPKKAADESKQQGTSKIGYELTAAVMEAFHRGLTVELGLQKEYRNRLAGLKTVEEYEECKKTAVVGAESEKVNKEYGVRMQKVNTSEEMNSLIGWLVKERESLTLRACGEDPAEARSHEVQVQTLRSAEMMGAIEFGTAFPVPEPPSDADQSGTTDNLDAGSDWCALGEDAGSAEAQAWLGGCGGEPAVGRGPAPDRIPVQGPDPYKEFCQFSEADQASYAEHGGSTKLRKWNDALVKYSPALSKYFQKRCKADKQRYNTSKEWIAAFCALPESAQDSMANGDGGVLGPGLQGAGMSYTSSEAKDLKQACHSTVYKLVNLIGEVMSGAVFR